MSFKGQQIVRSLKLAFRLSRKIKALGKSIGFVPTMGALHDGHLSLIRQARRENDFVVVSIFVNPTQFGPQEDFKKYPRDLKRDTRLCKKERVDVIFYPSAQEMYPQGYKTYVEVKDLSSCLCGKSRPGHFRGVATVVAKLFHLLQPDRAYFGQKDAQQVSIIKKMVIDLDFPVKIKMMPTLRESDGLALSSRNIYLNEEERGDAAILFKSLKLARNLIKKGTKDTDKIIQQMKQLIQKKKTVKIDYISIVDLDNLKPIERISGNYLIALAVWIGKTRLIDNIIIN